MNHTLKTINIAIAKSIITIVNTLKLITLLLLPRGTINVADFSYQIAKIREEILQKLIIEH